MAVAGRQVGRLRESGRRLSRNDLRVIVMAQLVRGLSYLNASNEALDTLERQAKPIEAAIRNLGSGAERVRRGESHIAAS